MTNYEFLQIYWWFLISVLGAILVFLLFVQGGQSMLLCIKDPGQRTMVINSLGRKWELTFTTLVVFGGAFFASFPLFYSTSFGGAYWLWMIILFSFVIQAVSYEYRSKIGNVLGQKTFDTFLFINGVVATLLLGVAVAMFFTGAEFTVEKQNILNPDSPVISQWGPAHGFEAIFCWKNLLLGVAVLFLSRCQAILYFVNNINDETTQKDMRKRLLPNAIIFVVFFLAFVGVVLLSSGYESTADGINIVDYKYFKNLIEMWWSLILFIIGVVLVLYAIIRTLLSRDFNSGIWYSGIGTVFVVLALFWIAGYNNTPYYPSLIDPASSLTIYNSSSTEYTLTVMSWVSVLIPFVLAYIAYVWYSMDKKKITAKEMSETDEKY